MRAAVLRAPKTITIEERPEPVPADDEVIVEAPLILGHEAAAAVVSARLRSRSPASICTASDCGGDNAETGAALTAGLRDPASIKPIVTPHAHA